MKLWLKILKSGKYKPTTSNYLCNKGKYSPIGTIMGLVHKITKDHESGVKSFEGHYSVCSDKLAKWLGFNDRFSMYNVQVLSKRFGDLFENDAGYRNWSSCIQAIEKLING